MQPLTFAPLLSVLTLLFGVVFSVLTLRQWQRTRYLSAAAELVHTIQTPEFTRSIALIVELPKDVEPNRLLSDTNMLAAFYTVTHVFESIGVLVYYRLLPLYLVDHLLGGYVRASWRRVGPIVTAQRQTVGIGIAEWYQWLAERLDQFPADGKKQGAAIAFRNWQP